MGWKFECWPPSSEKVSAKNNKEKHSSSHIFSIGEWEWV